MFLSEYKNSDSNNVKCSIMSVLSAEAFPIDVVDGNFARSVKNCIFSKSSPTPLKGPLRLAAASKVTSRQRQQQHQHHSET